MGQLENRLKFHLRRAPFLKNLIKKVFRIQAVNDQIASLERKLIYDYIASLHFRLEKLEKNTGTNVLKTLDFGDTRPPRFSKLVSQAATMEQMRDREYLEWCTRIHEGPSFHRKFWEYVYILKALDQHGKFQTGFRGLGFGVGKDPMVAYMVKRGCQVTATDLDPARAYEKGWAQTNQYSEKLLNLNERRICSDRELKKNVQLLNVDMNAIPTELLQGQYDFVWSACAYEHLGSIENGLAFVMNSLKALKPGGVAVHTTELNISSNDETLTSGATVLFRKRDFEELARRVKELGYQIDLNFHLGTQPQDQYYDVAPYSEFNHLRLQLGQYLTTSYGVIIRKPN